MPLNALQIVDQFRMKSQADRRAEQMNEVAGQMKMDEAMRGMRNRNVLGELAKSNPNDPRALAEQYIAQTGDAETGFRLQDRADRADDRANQAEDRAYNNQIRQIDSHMKGLKWISETGKMVSKENYGAWKQSAERLGISAAGELPDEYDQDVMDRLTGAANAELKEVKLNLPGRKQQQIFTRGGKEVYRSEPYERDAPKNAPETWGAPYEQNGQMYQRSTRGKVSAVGGRGSQSGDIGLMDRLVGSGIAKDDREAWQMLQDYKKNPTAGAQQIARMEVQAQKDAGIMPGDADYRSPAEIFQDVRRQMAEFEEPAADGTGSDGEPAPTKPAPGDGSWKPNNKDVRADGTQKGEGWLGVQKRPGGGVSTEISVGVSFDGKETEIPLMVPGLTKPELDYLTKNDPKSPDFLKNLPKSIERKAIAHARKRMEWGRSPFREPGEPLPPKIGAVEEHDGEKYRYMGGDPRLPKNWKPAQ